MSTLRLPALDPQTVEERRGSGYPEPFRSRMGDRVKRRLGDACGLTRFGVNLVTLGPGGQSALRHWHTLEDEFVYVLEGECSVRLIEPGQAPREVPLRPGHAVCFPAGTGIAHCLVNRGTKEAVVLGFGERRDADDRVFYPEDEGYNDDLREHRPERFWAFPARKP